MRKPYITFRIVLVFSDKSSKETSEIELMKVAKSGKPKWEEKSGKRMTIDDTKFSNF